MTELKRLSKKDWITFFGAVRGTRAYVNLHDSSDEEKSADHEASSSKSSTVACDLGKDDSQPQVGSHSSHSAAETVSAPQSHRTDEQQSGVAGSTAVEGRESPRDVEDKDKKSKGKVGAFFDKFKKKSHPPPRQGQGEQKNIQEDTGAKASEDNTHHSGAAAHEHPDSRTQSKDAKASTVDTADQSVGEVEPNVQAQPHSKLESAARADPSQPSDDVVGKSSHIDDHAESAGPCSEKQSLQESPEEGNVDPPNCSENPDAAAAADDDDGKAAGGFS